MGRTKILWPILEQKLTRNRSRNSHNHSPKHWLHSRFLPLSLPIDKRTMLSEARHYPYLFQKKFCPKPWPAIFAKADLDRMLHTMLMWPFIEQNRARIRSRMQHNPSPKDVLHSPFFSKDILPKNLTPHFCTSLFLHNVEHDCSVTYCRAETYTESSDEKNTIIPENIGFIPTFQKKFCPKPDSSFLQKESLQKTNRSPSPLYFTPLFL